MRRRAAHPSPARILAALATAGLVSGAAHADTATWNVIFGHLTDEETERTHDLSGSLTGRPGGAGSPPLRMVRFDEFSLEAGPWRFETSVVPTFEVFADGGMLALAQPIDLLRLDGDQVTQLSLRSGDAVVSETLTDATLGFHALDAQAGRVLGEIGDSGLPRRIEVQGVLLEVRQELHAVKLCFPGPIVPPLPQPPPGGGVVIGSRALDVEPLVRPGGSAVFGAVSPSLAAAALAPAPPSLEELGIEAPLGGTVSFLGGELLVTSPGDLLVHGAAVDLPGLERVRVSTPSDIALYGSLQVPPDVLLSFEAGGRLESFVLETPPDDPPIQPACPWTVLGPSGTRARPLGRFTLVAAPARPVRVALLAGRGNELDPAERRRIRAALLGSETLDVRDVVPSSLRLGDATPVAGRRGATTLRDVNRDGHDDLVGVFALQETGLAYGDSALCLEAETALGEALAGCDDVDTRPRTIRGGSPLTSISSRLHRLRTLGR